MLDVFYYCRYPPRTKENKTLEDYEWELRDTAWPPQVLELERNLPSPERYGPESWETRLATMYWEIMHVYATRLLDIAMEVCFGWFHLIIVSPLVCFYKFRFIIKEMISAMFIKKA